MRTAGRRGRDLSGPASGTHDAGQTRCPAAPPTPVITDPPTSDRAQSQTPLVSRHVDAGMTAWTVRLCQRAMSPGGARASSHRGSSAGSRAVLQVQVGRSPRGLHPVHYTGDPQTRPGSGEEHVPGVEVAVQKAAFVRRRIAADHVHGPLPRAVHRGPDALRGRPRLVRARSVVRYDALDADELSREQVQAPVEDVPPRSRVTACARRQRPKCTWAAHRPGDSGCRARTATTAACSARADAAASGGLVPAVVNCV